MRHLVVALLLVATTGLSAMAQASTASASGGTAHDAPPQGGPDSQPPPIESATRPDALRVFLDCEDCDFNYIRTEITFVNYVRDRRDAQVHVLVTPEPVGGGGTRYTLAFIGLEAFAAIKDTLYYDTLPQDTADAERRGLAQVLRVGLVRYVAETPLLDGIDISARAVTTSPTAATPATDPWNLWVFRTRVSARISGDASRTSRVLSGSFSSSRTTPQWITRVGLNASYNELKVDLSDGRRVTNTTQNYAVDGRLLKSVGAHGGLGLGGSVVRSTFRNQALSLRLAPAVQYNLFPYSESTRRQLTVTYNIGLNAFEYDEVTLFDKITERRADESLIVEFDVDDPWGGAGLAVEVSHFLDDRSQYRAVVLGSINIRVRRGLSLVLSGSGSRIHDQIFLPRADQSDEDVLLRRQQLATDFDYRFSVGLTYSFGSIYNNVVNSRFAGTSGGFVRAF